MPSLFRSGRSAFPAILILAFAVRLLGISSRPIWYDEAFSILFAEKGPAAMLRGTLPSASPVAAEEHPLAYYTLLWGWMRVFGESLVSVRMLSVLAGLGVVAVVYLLARGLFDAPVAQAAALLAALAPFQVHFSQEIRMYAFMSLWLLLATYAYWRATSSGRWTWWLWFALFAALAEYTHNLAAFYLLALALWPLLVRDWQSLKGVILAGCLALLLYLPWLVHLPAQLAKVGQSYWIEKPGAYRVITLLLEYVIFLPVHYGWLAVGLFITLLVTVIAAWQTIRAVREHRPGIHHESWVLYLAFVPPALLFLFSQWKPVYLERALLPSGAAFCIWLAWALRGPQAARPIRVVTITLLMAGFGMGLYEHITDTGGLYGPYQALTEDLRSKLQPGDVIVHSNKLSMLPAVYFDRHLPQTYIADVPESGNDTLAPSTQRVLGLVASPDIASAVGNADRVWFIIFTESNQEYIQAGYPRHPQLSWLMEHYSQVEERDWGTLRVYLFSKTPAHAFATPDPRLDVAARDRVR